MGEEMVFKIEEGFDRGIDGVVGMFKEVVFWEFMNRMKYLIW